MQACAETPVDASTTAQLSDAGSPAMSPPIRLACAEVGNFRRLAQTRLDFDDCTTVLVGANNSGKTSLLIALRNFLS